MNKKYDQFDSALPLKDEDKILICQKDENNKNINTLTTVGSLKAHIDSTKMGIVVGETLPETRDKNTIYFKITSSIQTEVSNQVKISPNMGLKIEE